MVIFCFLSGSHLAQTQAVTEFTPQDRFAIPTKNGNISFAVNGTYSQARLENDTWIFTDLQLAYSPNTLPYIQISAQDCNVTIRMYGRFSSVDSSGIFWYNVTGQGTQTVKFNLEPIDREWSVIFDGEFFPEGQDWHLADDETLTITPQSVNVTLFFMNYPSDVGKNSSLPFYQRHSAVIATGIIVAVIVAVATIVRIKNQKTSKAEGGE